MFSESISENPCSRILFPSMACMACIAVAVLSAVAQASSPDDNSTLHLPAQAAREGTIAKHSPEHHYSVRPHANETGSSDPLIRAKPGPWGDLEYYTVYLEATAAQL